MKLLVLRKLHKWVTLFVGLQLLMWTSSGLMFAWLDHHQVSGEQLAAVPDPLPLGAEIRLSDPNAWMAQHAGQAIREISLRPLNGEWVYRITHADGAELRDATDGKRTRIDSAAARILALSHYRGNGRLIDVTYLPQPTLETRTAGATWRAAFDDDAGTSLYFSADDGTLVVARTDQWRIFDFFWMLHTMDYSGRDDFNNPLVILAGSAALWIALTGVLLLFRVFRWNPAFFRRPVPGSRP